MTIPEERIVRALMAMSDSSKIVFVHELSLHVQRWHYGDCFPDVESCAVPNGADLDDAQAS